MNWIIIAAMCACLAIGFYCGWIAREDHNAAREYQLAYPRGRHAAAAPLRLRNTSELAALYGKPYPAASEASHGAV